MRIVSLVPSLTEFLYDLGLEHEVVGITKFCIHPNQWFQEKTRIGGTKNPKIEKILELRPDLVIANKEENRKEDVEALQRHCRVLCTDINNLSEQEQALGDIAAAVGKSERGKMLIQEIKEGIATAKSWAQHHTALYLIWNNPIMIAGKNTFIDAVLSELGIENKASALPEPNRYPQLSEEQIQDTNADLLLLSSEPYPFKEKHLLHFQRLVPNSKILLVDGEVFSWYGTRMKFLPQHWRSLKSHISAG